MGHGPVTRYESAMLIVHVPRPFRVWFKHMSSGVRDRHGPRGSAYQHATRLYSHVPGVLLPMWTLVAPYCKPNAKGCFEKAQVPNQFSQHLASPSVKTSLACIGSGWLLSIVRVPPNPSFRPSDSQMPSQVQV
ncbi:uncharacterized protein G2W53_017999 [Senna tora]|uniref:Uncharacterized protein n=1 Tax=Senna tora TaxID=362788 RepID=A0A834WKP0_9FABA|nr:uncharacterized protein G2W53_017999 [Senna tora]